MFQLSLSPSLSPLLSLSLPHSLSLSPLSVSHSFSLTLSHSHSLSFSISLSLTLSHSLSLTHSLLLFLSLSVTCLLTLTINEYLIRHLLYYCLTISNFSIIIFNHHRGRFDPTAYQQRKDEISRDRFRRSASRSNSSSRGKDRYNDGDTIGQRSSNR